MIYGYVRVSTKEQNEDRQLIAMNERQINRKNIFIDKESGKDFNRQKYQQLLRKLRKGDIIVIKSIDRLGRNYKEIIEQWRKITQTKKADIIVLDMPLLDTTKNKDLLGTLISDLILQILSFVAENERTLIRQRQSEGIAAAKAKGIKFGRPKKYLLKDYNNLFEKKERGEITTKQLLETTKMSKGTYINLMKEYKNKK